MATKFRFVYPPIMVASLILALLLPAGSPAQDEGQWRLDTVSPVGKDPKLPSNALPGEDVKGWWWMPITNVNSLIQQLNDEYSFITTVPEQPVPNMWVFPLFPYSAPIETLEVDTTGNATGQPVPDIMARWGLALIETEHYVMVIGSAMPGQAVGVKQWINTNIGKPIRYVVISDVYESPWFDWYTYGQPLTVIESGSLYDALVARSEVLPYQLNPPSSTGTRVMNAKGLFLPRDTNWRLDGFSLKTNAGVCMGEGIPSVPGVTCLDIQGEEQTVNLDGLVFRFINVLDEIGGLVTYVPTMGTLIPPSLFDGHLLNTAPLQGPVIPIRKVIAAVELMQTLDIDCYFPLNGFPLVGELDDGRSIGSAYLNATWSVLTSIRVQIVSGLRNNQSLDQILTAATIPAYAQDLCIEEFQPMSPCGEFENSLASIVKGMYTEYMGWFDGTARSLSAHVTSADKASLFLELANDMDGLMSVAAKLTAAADDLASIERTLYLVEPLHELAVSPEIDEMYFQLLWKAGMLQTATDLRNYYMTLAWQHNPYW